MVKWKDITNALANGEDAWQSNNKLWVIYRSKDSDNGDTLYYVTYCGVFYCMTATYEIALGIVNLTKQYDSMELK